MNKAQLLQMAQRRVCSWEVRRVLACGAREDLHPHVRFSAVFYNRFDFATEPDADALQQV